MHLSAVPKRCQPLKIVALGDSLVYGFGDPEGGGWVERLRRCWMLADSPGHVLYNLGVRGDRIQQVSQRLGVEFRHRGELRNQVPDLIILSVGVNDSARLGRLNGRNYTDFAVFESHIAFLLDQAQQLCPVLFVGMVPVDQAKMPFMNCFYYNHADQHRYKEAIRVACTARKIPYLDIFQKWMERTEAWRLKRLSKDGLHPNTLGYQTLLEDVISWEAFASYNFSSCE
ncbi:G-D-S-L family lipolytic protein [Brasilonema octagenarum UFV-E1]|uniref:G-D-S-L family lipolytic protein n=3 Tax=Scytonemataceae TaxID=1182 RepID=A0A856MFF6_9CYAN|nr:G-D-S-L family lipolytic protein [Brasilonema octagenarum UFV-OR1]QDL09034.1 G-D-S-L family lipolytic protein [Brasilonema sennae CENA114]QDL15391.1 G-D-S-L family lipolytic protein [Brasilonema octagenarum UFV-E1]